jgi:hypothetical protein
VDGVFKYSDFSKWARKERISDKTLHQAATEIVEGKVEADLGDNLFKKRLAKPGRGKSSGWRLIVGYRKPNTDRVVFVFGFGKNEAPNISQEGHKALAITAERVISANDQTMKALLKTGAVIEVKSDHERK